MAKDPRGIHFGRRDFIKTTAFASMVASFPATGFALQSTFGGSKPSPEGKGRKLLFLGDRAIPEQFNESIRSIKEYEINVSSNRVNFDNPQELAKTVQDSSADIVFISIPSFGIALARFADHVENLDVPLILLPQDLTLIMLAADMAARLRRKGINALLANSESHAIELIRIAASPRVLEGKKARIYGRPFDSSSVPAPNLSEDYIFKHTGVRLEYRDLSELAPLVQNVDEAAAKKEMERWKKEAQKIVEPTDESMLRSCRMYVLLRSIIDAEGLSAISLDCLSFSFSRNPVLPLPCIAYTRLLNEGISTPCEADVVMLLSTLLLQNVSRRPPFFHNVSAVDVTKSHVILRHCVAPTQLMGADAKPLPFNLRDYHGMGRDLVPEVEFPIGKEVTMGGFSKDLKSFVLWPGRIQPEIMDTDTPSFPGGASKMRKFCSNRVEVKIKDVDRFIQSIAGIHQVMIAGNFANEIIEAMLRMGVNVIAPPDLTAPV